MSNGEVGGDDTDIGTWTIDCEFNTCILSELGGARLAVGIFKILQIDFTLLFQ